MRMPSVSFCEHMQHVDGVLELGNIENAIFTIRMHSNFNDSSADECNRPPVAG
jgi:hypothetical protein